MALNKCWILPGLTSHSLNRHQLNTEASRGKLNWQLNLSDYMHTNAYLPHWKRASEHCWKTNVKTMSLVSCLVSGFYSTCHRKEVMMEKKGKTSDFPSWPQTSSATLISTVGLRGTQLSATSACDQQHAPCQLELRSKQSANPPSKNLYFSP